jgi:hypothetical protein
MGRCAFPLVALLVGACATPTGEAPPRPTSDGRVFYGARAYSESQAVYSLDVERQARPRLLGRTSYFAGHSRLVAWRRGSARAARVPVEARGTIIDIATSR